jgi:hypothetical protein
MKAKLKLCLRTAWLTAVIVLLLQLMSLGGPDDRSFFDAGESMLFFMGLLSFPVGPLVVMISMFILDSLGIQYASNYVNIWLLLACGGYLQWFIVLPRLRAKDGLTILNLRGTQIPTTPISPKPHRRISKQRAGRIRAISAFDNQGRTPLERAISRRL